MRLSYRVDGMTDGRKEESDREEKSGGSPWEGRGRGEAELAHVLFLDFVGFSKLLTDQQHKLKDRLQRAVAATHEYAKARESGELIVRDTGDGFAFVLRTPDPAAAARLAIAIASSLARHRDIPVRLGINTGLVTVATDLDGAPNVTGDGINEAQRVMDCGDAGHILLGESAAKSLLRLGDWKDALYDLGEHTVKHGLKLRLYNLRRGTVGNAEPLSRTSAHKPEDPSTYLKILREDNEYIEIRGLQTGGNHVHRIPLDKIYVPLMNQPDAEEEGRARTQRGAKGRPSWFYKSTFEGSRYSVEARPTEESRPTDEARPTEAGLSEALKYSRLLIVGDPGSGKSTFLKWVVTRSSDNDFPVLIRIGELAAHMAAQKSAGNGPAIPYSPQWLPHFLGAQSQTYQWELSGAYFNERLKNGCLVLLDGLDESPDENVRSSMGKLLQECARAYRDSKFVVTTRPASYTQENALAGFAHHRIAEFGPAAIRTFLEQWSEALMSKNKRQSGRHFHDLWEAVGRKPEILRMASNPVMLTALATLHWNNKTLPDQRAELYDSILDWLAKSRKDRPGRTTTPAQCLRLLQNLALKMQFAERGRKVQVSNDWAAREAGMPEGFLDTETVDSGIVVSRGRDVRFWHLTFQEFLAARALDGMLDSKRHELLSPRVYSSELRETVLLFGGLTSSERLEALVNEILNQAGTTLADRARCVGLLGSIERDHRAAGYKLGNPRYTAALEEVYAIFDGETAKTVPFETRIAAAEALGQVGDRRLHENNWVTIPAGSFTMGDGSANDNSPHEVYLDAFQIAKYPVTVDEYRQFVESDAFECEAPEDWEKQKPHGNRPVVNVSWHDASAYCAWRGFRLPTEAEWERTARGSEGRKYPWGSEQPNPSLAAFGDSVRSAVPVGLYPLGSTPDGIMDMAGNVWEWCSDWYASGYYRGSPRENPQGPDSGESRVVRGGSWFNYSLVLPACRFLDHPGNRYNAFGFRCVRQVA